jgi:hypothetical protein
MPFPFFNLGESSEMTSSPFPSFPMASPDTYATITSFLLESVGAPMVNFGVRSTTLVVVPSSGTVTSSQGVSHGLGNFPPRKHPQPSGNTMGSEYPPWGSQFLGTTNPSLGSSNVP